MLKRDTSAFVADMLPRFVVLTHSVLAYFLNEVDAAVDANGYVHVRAHACVRACGRVSRLVCVLAG